MSNQCQLDRYAYFTQKSIKFEFYEIKVFILMNSCTSNWWLNSSRSFSHVDGFIFLILMSWSIKKPSHIDGVILIRNESFSMDLSPSKRTALCKSARLVRNLAKIHYLWLLKVSVNSQIIFLSIDAGLCQDQ